MNLEGVVATLDELAKSGIEAINAKEFATALEKFQAALALDDSRPDLHNALGMTYMHLGRIHDAIPTLERAVELAEPYDADDVQDMKRHMTLTLATAYEISDQVVAARRLFEAAVASWPTALEPRLSLGQLLLSSCYLEDGLAVYRALMDFDGLDDEGKEAAAAVVGATENFLRSEETAAIFLKAHAGEYRRYFDEILAPREEEGWYAEAARMARGPDGEPKPIIPEGARPYAMQRVDLVNPNDGTVAEVYNQTEPMIVAIEGAEPLAQLPVMLPWEERPFETWVCTQCPWHWMTITIEFVDAADPIGTVDPIIGDWYLAGFNGEFGDRDSGRFHYITDPDPVKDHGVTYAVDLGRSRFDAIASLCNRLLALHDRVPIRRVLFGSSRLPT